MQVYFVKCIIKKLRLLIMITLTITFASEFQSKDIACEIQGEADKIVWKKNV